jgi:energy-coupling factor transporter ATP-binding protein EcfA2
MLQGSNLTLTHQDGDTPINAVNGVSINIQDHQFIGILGPSGSGKSSLLYLLSGLRQASQGEIYLDGRAYGKRSPCQCRTRPTPCRPGRCWPTWVWATSCIASATNSPAASGSEWPWRAP